MPSEESTSPTPMRVTSISLVQLLDISSEALVVVNQAGTIVMTNEQMEVLFAYTKEEMEGQPLEVLLPKRFHATHRAYREHYFTTPQTRPMATELHLFGSRKNGTEFPIDIRLKPIMLDKVLHVFGTIRDITEQRWMEGEITKYSEDERSLTTLNTILSATSEFVYLIDRDGRYRFASERAAELLALQQHDFIGKTWQDLGLPAEFVAPFEAKRQQVMTTGQAIIDEMLFPVAIGMRWFEYVVHPIKDQDGKVISVVVSSKDITDHKQAADMLHRLASIVESSGEAIFSKTPEGVITSWNKAAEQLFGYRANEIIGQSASLLFSPELQQEHLELLAYIKQGKAFKDLETTRTKKDGTNIEVSITISPILDPKGHVIGTSTIAHDITERKRMFQELTSLNIALQNANQARNQFLATMSHELRTPLASIIGFSEMLLEDITETGVNQQQQENLERILRNSEHLLDLINDVLDLSKIEAGRMPLDYRQVNVPEMLSSVTKEIQSLAVTQNLILRAEVGEGATTCETDPRKLHQILLNLLSNALKFTEQGAVTLSTKRVLLSDQTTEGIAFIVKDTGIGISSDIQKQIFEPFYQADMSYTRKIGGTGLGLAIVSQLTALLGGTITLESTPGQGSTFTVTLPLKADHQYVEQDIPRLNPDPQHEAPTLSPHKLASEFLAVSEQQEASKEQYKPILVVDDNADVIALVKAALRDMAYTVIGMQDPLNTIKLVQELHPCAIILDVMIPQLNGWQLLHQLKNNPTTASIPVIMLTVLSEQTTGYVLGADDYMIKPFKKEVLRHTLQSLIETKKGPLYAAKNNPA